MQPEVCVESSRKSLLTTWEKNRNVFLRHLVANCRGEDLGKSLRFEAVGSGLEGPVWNADAQALFPCWLWGAVGSLEFKEMVKAAQSAWKDSGCLDRLL